MANVKKETEEGVGKIDNFANCCRSLQSAELPGCIKAFSACKNGEERITWVNYVIPREKLPLIENIKTNKNGEKAKELKEAGNKSFAEKEYKKCVEFYTKAAMMTPQDEGTKDLSLCLANRSAALYCLEEYESAVKDIDVVLELDYPKDLRYKVLERKAKCLLALHKNEEAKKVFKMTIRALDDSMLGSKKKLKMQTDIQIMLKMLLNSGGDSKAAGNARQEETHKHKLISPRHKVYVSACDRLEFKEDPTAGRYAVAGSDLDVGDTILIEKPYCTYLLPEMALTNCHHCMRRTVNLYPCKNCNTAAFCSSKCRNSATYHKYECPVQSSLSRLEASGTVAMALRIIAQNDLQYFIDIKPKLKEAETRTEIPTKYDGTDYTRIYQLVHHEQRRSTVDLFERTILALHLLRCLKEANYFDCGPSKGTELTDSEKFIGSLILRHLQILQFNAHEISALKMCKNFDLTEHNSVFIGCGIYGTLSLFNHSCDPGIVRYFDGTKVIVRTAKPIKSGEIIAENYGPIYSNVKKQERQSYLKDHYKFDCTCKPCSENWPLLDDMLSGPSVLRFRCRPNKGNKNKDNQTPCTNVLVLPMSRLGPPQLKCSACGSYTNILPGLLAIQGNIGMSMKAVKLFKAGDHEKALNTFFKLMKTLDEHLAPPFVDYINTQHFVRECMLTFGNKYYE